MVVAHQDLTVLASGTAVSGRVAGRDLDVPGQFDGELELSGRVHVAAGSRGKGRVRANLVQIDGDFEGEGRTETLRLGVRASPPGKFYRGRRRKAHPEALHRGQAHREAFGRRDARGEARRRRKADQRGGRSGLTGAESRPRGAEVRVERRSSFRTGGIGEESRGGSGRDAARAVEISGTPPRSGAQVAQGKVTRHEHALVDAQLATLRIAHAGETNAVQGTRAEQARRGPDGDAAVEAGPHATGYGAVLVDHEEGQRRH